MPSNESKGSQLDAIGSLAQRQLDNTPAPLPAQSAPSLPVSTSLVSSGGSPAPALLLTLCLFIDPPPIVLIQRSVP